MRYRIGLLLGAGVILALGLTLFGVAPAGLASDEDQSRTIDKAPDGALCRSMLSGNPSASSSLVTYLLHGQSDHGAGGWELESWKQFGLPRDSVALPAAANAIAGAQSPLAVTVDV